MPGSKGGFFGGLLEGVGAAVFGAQQKKQERERQDRQVVASLLLKGLDADPTRETARAVLRKVGELFHEPAAHLFGIKVGKKGNDPITQMLEGIVQAYPTRDELTAREVKKAEDTSKARETGTITGKAEAELSVAQRMIDKGQAKNMPEAMSLLFGRRGPASGVKVLPGSMTFDQIIKGDPDAKNLSGEALTGDAGSSWQRVEIPTDDPNKPEIRYIVGPQAKNASGADFLKGLTGQAKEAVTESLMTKFHVTPGEATKEQIQGVVDDASKLLTGRRQLDDANKRAMLALRNWNLGTDISGGGGTPASTPAASDAPAAPAATPPAAPAEKPGPLTGLSEVDATEVKEIAAYKKQLPARYAQTPRGAKLMAAADKLRQSQGLDPLDQTQYQTRQRARIAFTTGKESQEIRSLGQLAGHLTQAAKAAQALGNADTHLWNDIANRGLEQVGDPRVVAFTTPAAVVSNEITRLTRGGVGSKADIEDFKDKLSKVRSPAELRTTLDAIQKLANSRVDQLRQQWRSVMGDEPFTFLSPEAEKVYGGMSRATTKVGAFTVTPIEPTARTPEAPKADRPSTSAPARQQPTYPLDQTRYPTSSALPGGVSPRIQSAAPPEGTTMSEKGIAALRDREGGFYGTPYQDSGTGLAIGYGMHTWEGKPVSSDLRVTEAQGTREMERQVHEVYAPMVNRALKVPVNQDQFDALVSIAWNRPQAAMRLIGRLNRGETLTAKDFKISTTVKGQRSPALETRRREEAATFAGR